MKLNKFIITASALILSTTGIGFLSNAAPTTAQASSNNITNREIKNKTYYGKKAIVYYGLTHAKGEWNTIYQQIYKKNRGIILIQKNGWTIWQAGTMGDTSFHVYGDEVVYGQTSFKQEVIKHKHAKPLVVNVGTVRKYINSIGGKHKLNSMERINTHKELDKLTDNAKHGINSKW